MGFSISKFFDQEPLLGYRFFVEFFNLVSDCEERKNVSYYVKSVTFPSMGSGEGENFIFLGNGILGIPTYNPAGRELTIVFEETDYLTISKYIDNILEKQYFYNQLPTIYIGVTEFLSDMRTPLRQKLFSCRLKSYEPPEFSNAGGANICTTTMVFVVDAEENWNGTDVEIKNIELSKIGTNFNHKAPKRLWRLNEPKESNIQTGAKRTITGDIFSNVPKADKFGTSKISTEENKPVPGCVTEDGSDNGSTPGTGSKKIKHTSSTKNIELNGISITSVDTIEGKKATDWVILKGKNSPKHKVEYIVNAGTKGNADTKRSINEFVYQEISEEQFNDIKKRFNNKRNNNKGKLGCIDNVTFDEVRSALVHFVKTNPDLGLTVDSLTDPTNVAYALSKSGFIRDRRGYGQCAGWTEFALELAYGVEGKVSTHKSVTAAYLYNPSSRWDNVKNITNEELYKKVLTKKEFDKLMSTLPAGVMVNHAVIKKNGSSSFHSQIKLQDGRWASDLYQKGGDVYVSGQYYFDIRIYSLD